MLIGLTGYAQSGKDTLAQILVEEHGFVRIAFADKIRKFLYETNPMIDNVAGEPIFLKERVDRDGWDETKKNPHVRRIMQTMGVAARNNFGDDFWIREAFGDVRHSQKIVVTDVRFRNEADWIKQYENSHIWRVKRNGVEPINAHVSESEMDGYKADQIFANNGTVEDLRDLLNKRMELV